MSNPTTLPVVYVVFPDGPHHPKFSDYFEAIWLATAGFTRQVELDILFDSEGLSSVPAETDVYYVRSGSNAGSPSLDKLSFVTEADTTNPTMRVFHDRIKAAFQEAIPGQWDLGKLLVARYTTVHFEDIEVRRAVAMANVLDLFRFKEYLDDYMAMGASAPKKFIKALISQLRPFIEDLLPEESYALGKKLLFGELQGHKGELPLFHVINFWYMKLRSSISSGKGRLVIDEDALGQIIPDVISLIYQKEDHARMMDDLLLEFQKDGRVATLITPEGTQWKNLVILFRSDIVPTACMHENTGLVLCIKPGKSGAYFILQPVYPGVNELSLTEEYMEKLLVGLSHKFSKCEWKRNRMTVQSTMRQQIHVSRITERIQVIWERFVLPELSKVSDEAEETEEAVTSN